MSKLKILYFNWIDFEDARQRGGGASIYQRNLIDAARQRDDEVWFLSSGICYSPFSRRPFLREVKARKKGVRKFEIVNSTIIAPGHNAFGQDVAAAPELEALFADFLRRHGSFDVVHFNNLEGIPVSFLRLAREHYPQTKILFSIHNYFAFCPQVNLWFQDREACDDFQDGRKCVNCLRQPAPTRRARWLYHLDGFLRALRLPVNSFVDRFINWFLLGLAWRSYNLARGAYRVKGSILKLPQLLGVSLQPIKPTAILAPADAARFAARRRLFVTALNTYADHVLAVSRRVAELARGFGIDAAKVHTLYIGSRFAEANALVSRDAKGNALSLTHRVSNTNPTRQRGSVPLRVAANPSDVLRILYLGYMRHDKGFYFFLKALKKLPAELASRLAVTFAAKIADPAAYTRIKRLAHHFASVTFYDGYSPSQLPEMLSAIDLGIVPVLWEDSLPQVAIECVASGVPVLTSDRGGAQELLNCRDLVFAAGSYDDFYAKLRNILDNPSILSAALAGRARLYTPREHYEYLREHYYRNPMTAEKAPKRTRQSIAASKLRSTG